MLELRETAEQREARLARRRERDRARRNQERVDTRQAQRDISRAAQQLRPSQVVLDFSNRYVPGMLQKKKKKKKKKRNGQQTTSVAGCSGSLHNACIH